MFPRLLALCGLRTLRVRREPPFERLEKLRYATSKLDSPFGLILLINIYKLWEYKMFDIVLVKIIPVGISVNIVSW